MVGYLTGMTYNIETRTTGATLGNFVVLAYGYDDNRSQLISLTATKSGTQLMNLTLDYHAQPGQSGVGSTLGNTHQLISLSGTINGTTESASYRYDDAKRLVSSDQTTNGASAQRRFVYDRWGNRTTVYPAVSGGSAIQTVTLEQSGSAPTNRIASVNNNGTISNYLYDAAGNITYDGTHTYAYDAANRLVNVDAGASAQYRYDHNNQRVTKIVGSSWTHYIWEGGQVIGEHDATTAYSTTPPYQEKSARLDYIYAREKLIYTRQRSSSTAPWTARYYVSDVWSSNEFEGKTDFRPGLAVLRIEYDDGSHGILMVSCHGTGTPNSVFEGITASKDFVDFWSRFFPVRSVATNARRWPSGDRASDSLILFFSGGRITKRNARGSSAER